MVFYAYAKNNLDDVTYRYLITATSLEVLDGWWRAISTKNIGFARVTPEFYTFSAANTLPPTTVENANYAPQFLNLLIFTLLNDRDGRIFSLFPPQQFSDHVSGGTFYIRSKSDQGLFWYVTSDGKVYGSTTNRTRFQIQTTDTTLIGQTMIPTDQVEILVVGTTNSYVSSGSDNTLSITNQAESYAFSDLTGPSTFLAQGPTGGTPVLSLVHGEAWELAT